MREYSYSVYSHWDLRLCTARKQRLEPRKPPIQKRSRATVNEILSAAAQVFRRMGMHPGRPTASLKGPVYPLERFISISQARRRSQWRCWKDTSLIPISAYMSGWATWSLSSMDCGGPFTMMYRGCWRCIPGSHVYSTSCSRRLLCLSASIKRCLKPNAKLRKPWLAFFAYTLRLTHILGTGRLHGRSDRRKFDPPLRGPS